MLCFVNEFGSRTPGCQTGCDFFFEIKSYDTQQSPSLVVKPSGMRGEPRTEHGGNLTCVSVCLRGMGVYFFISRGHFVNLHYQVVVIFVPLSIICLPNRTP